MKTVLEKMKVKLQLDMLVSKNKRYFIVFYILFLYTGVYSMSLSETIVAVDNAVCKPVYLGDYYKCEVFQREKEQFSFSFDECQDFLLNEPHSGTQLITFLLLYETKDLNRMINLQNLMVSMYCDGKIDDQELLHSFDFLSAIYVLIKNYNNPSIISNLRKLINNSDTTQQVKKSANDIISGKWWRTIKKTDKKWKSKV